MNKEFWQLRICITFFFWEVIHVWRYTKTMGNLSYMILSNIYLNIYLGHVWGGNTWNWGGLRIGDMGISHNNLNVYGINVIKCRNNREIIYLFIGNFIGKLFSQINMFGTWLSNILDTSGKYFTKREVLEIADIFLSSCTVFWVILQIYLSWGWYWDSSWKFSMGNIFKYTHMHIYIDIINIHRTWDIYIPALQVLCHSSGPNRW